MSRFGTMAARFGGVLERMAPQARGRLFRKYAILLLALVGGALVVNAGVEAIYSYQENRQALVALQREKAQGAAAVIEQFVKEIEGQLGWTTHASIVQGGAGAEQRRFEFLRLLRQAPAITEVAWIDAQGREQLRVSRLAMDVIGSGADFSQDQRFVEAKANKRFVSPVYFRKESEPYLTLALTGTSRSSGVAVAEVNLKFIWDVVSRIRVGKAGAAYVLDERGFLIAHPDIGLVLRKTDLSGLDHVAAALAALKHQLLTADLQPIGRDRAARDVLAASAPIPTLRWLVFVEQPLAEAYRPIYESLWRSGLVLATGLAVAALAGLWLAKRMVVPIRALADGAARLGGGDLDYRISISTGLGSDDFQALADGFNEMGARLKDSYATLEHKVEVRTQELSEALAHQTATSDVLGVISRSPSQIQPVLDAIVKTAGRLCRADYAFVFRLHDDGKYHVAAADRDVPAFMDFLVRNPLSSGDGSLTGRVAAERRTIHLPDATCDPAYRWSAWLELTRFHTFLSVPLLREGEVTGVIALARVNVEPFSDKQIELVTTFADQAVIAIENARLFEEVQARTAEVQEALEYQTATSEVLGVISRSPSVVEPVFDAIVHTAARLCGADHASIYRLREGIYQFEAGDRTNEEFTAYCKTHPIPPGRGSLVGRTAILRSAVHLPDALADPEYETLESQRIGDYRSMLGVPLLRDGEPVGVIALVRTKVAPFSDRQIELVTTFADQAVIAIANARLFEEVQARTAEVTEALEYQTATSDVLNVISRSPSQIDPVLDAIVTTAAGLCDGFDATLLLRRGKRLHVGAHHGSIPLDFEAKDITPLWITGRAVLERRAVHVHDFAQEEAEFPEGYELHQRAGHRTGLAIPLLREGEAIGAFMIRRMEVNPFTQKQIAVLQTFADQAVIAIENARLFEEVQARTADVTEALEYQTATSEVLGVISRSPDVLQPVLDAIADTASRLCDAEFSILFNVVGNNCVVAASKSTKPGFIQYLIENPVPVFPGATVGRSVLEARTVMTEDVLALPGFTRMDSQRAGGQRTVLAVPLLRDGTAIGVIALMRSRVQAFTEKQVRLVETFANQAVIAINNVRLFDEVQARTAELSRSVAELKALGEVGQAVSSSLDLETVLRTILQHACEMADAGGGAVYVLDHGRGEFLLEAAHNMGEELIAEVREHPIRVNDTLIGQSVARREALQIEDLRKGPPHPLFDMHLKAGVRALLAVPLLHQNQVIGALVVRRRRSGSFTPEIVNLLQGFASQSSLAIYNARLFKEIEEKSRQLEIASQHKSQFLANMSHELRTPLNAILGYTELMQDGVYGELNKKTRGVLDRVQANGKHLLGLINDVLDLSKIEAGQLTLRIDSYSMSSVVQTVVAATESLAAEKRLPVRTEIDGRLPAGIGDERRLCQVLLNLVGNAIKFTDTGEVRLRASSRDGRFSVEVADTGPGIPESEQERIFEEFHQVDSSNTKKKGGSGLGLAISKRIVQMHGGRIWVDSKLGEGSTFHVELPIKAEQRAGAP